MVPIITMMDSYICPKRSQFADYLGEVGIITTIMSLRLFAAI